MKKLSVTYRATIDRTVPIAVRSRVPKKSSLLSRFIGRPRVRVSS